MTNRACRGAVISALFLVATACTDAVAPVPSTKAPARAAVMTPTEATLDSTSTSTTAPVCTATGAHGAHAFAGCSACHACAGGYELSPFTFPSGTAVEAGTISRTTEGTTCTTACHAPLGAEPQPVSWNAGPLRCTSCHTNIATTGAEPVRSSHVATATISDDTCTTCHDQSQHTSGTVRLIGGDGTTISTS